MRGWPIVITGWVFGSVAPVVLAQLPSVELKVRTRTLELGEGVDVQLVCTNTGRPDIPQVAVPDGLDLKLLNSIPTSSSFTQIINGRTSHRTTYTYTMSLIALKEGTYTLGPVTVTADARTYRTEPITIVVRKTDTASTPRGDRFIYAEIEVEPRSLYVTETYTARLTIGIRKVQIGRRTPEVDWISALWNGPSQLSVFRNGEWSRTESRLMDSAGTSRPYEILIATSNVRAEEVGVTQVGPVFLKVDYPTAVRSSVSRGTEASQSRKETARADAIIVEVKGPPEEGRPDDYTGALGRFSMNVTAKPTRLEQGQPITLTVSIRGAPLEGVAAPDLTKHPGLVSRFDFTADELVGDREGRAKVFRRAIFPRQIGEQTIPAISWSYFDPREERYVTLTSEPISISVDPPSATTATISMIEQPRPESNGTTLSVLTGGISPNFVDPDAVLANQSFTVTGPWAASLIVSPLVWLIVTLITRHRARLKADVNFARRRRARREAHGRVRRALRHKEPAQQIYGLAEAVTGYLSDRFGLPPATLTPGEVRSLLAAHGLKDTTTVEIVDFLETCDALRYAPGVAGNLSASQAAGRVRGWIRQIEGGTR